MPDGGGNPPIPEFPGAGRVYRLIRALYLRPRYGDWPRKLFEQGVHVVWGPAYPRTERAGRKGLPMVYLIRPDDSDTVVGTIDRLLNKATPRQAGPPHAWVQQFDGAAWEGARAGTWSHDDVLAIRDLLRVARNKLVISSDSRGQRLRFPLFSLVYLLMDGVPDPDEPNPGGWRVRLFRQQGVMQRIEQAVQTIDRDIVGDKVRWKIPLWLMYVLTFGVFRIVLTGRIPLLSGRYGWFMRQPHLAPELSGTFVRFAGRLVDWRDEDPEYVARLLVNAFLEDLRRGYRLPWWNVARTRRMTYPLLLLDDAGVTGGGDRLLWLVNEIRNQTGLFDPLLIVAAGATRHPSPARGRRDERRAPVPATESVLAYEEWQRRLSHNRRARRAITWYLPIDAGPVGTDPHPGLQGFVGFDLVDNEELEAVRPPLMANRVARICGAILVAVALASIPVRYSYSHCWSFTSSLDRNGSECVGTSDGSYALFQPSDATSRQVESIIYQQNRRASQEHAAFPQRPYITLAEVEATTSSDGTADGVTAERESLEGVATAQYLQLNKSGDADPIVRVLLVNAGKDMLQAKKVARGLGAFASHDRSLIGVVGLDMSSKPTSDMIKELSTAGLPMVASTLSVESLGTGNPMYFQVAPTNSTEADVVAAFADHQAHAVPPTPKTVRIYYSNDPTDTYTIDLRDDAQKAFRDKGFDVTVQSFTPGKANSAGQDTCGYNGFVFFAGRGVPDYGDFLSSAAQCSSKAVFIGDDDVSRYVADGPKRKASPALPFFYASFAFAPPIKDQNGAELGFYDRLDQLFPFEKQLPGQPDPVQGRSLDGHAALAYDAAEVMIQAASYLRAGSESIPITPGTVWREITDIHNNRHIDGVSGSIDYGGDITRQVPVRKPVDIMQVVKGDVNTDIVGFCGVSVGHTPSTWCP